MLLPFDKSVPNSVVAELAFEYVDSRAPPVTALSEAPSLVPGPVDSDDILPLPAPAAALVRLELPPATEAGDDAVPESLKVFSNCFDARYAASAASNASRSFSSTSTSSSSPFLVESEDNDGGRGEVLLLWMGPLKVDDDDEESAEGAEVEAGSALEGPGPSEAERGVTVRERGGSSVEPPLLLEGGLAFGLAEDITLAAAARAASSL